MDASQTKPSTPWTRPPGSVTAPGSLAFPILQVPEGCCSRSRHLLSSPRRPDHQRVTFSFGTQGNEIVDRSMPDNLVIHHRRQNCSQNFIFFIYSTNFSYTLRIVEARSEATLLRAFMNSLPSDANHPS